MVKKDLAKSKTEILLDLMKKRDKLAPVKSQRKLNKKYEKLMVEKFLPKDRPITELDERINSRRLKQALDAEYVEFNKKTHDKAKEALKKIVTKSAEDIFADKIKADKLAIKESLKKDSLQELLKYLEEGQSLDQVLMKTPGYVDASPKARAIMLKKIKEQAPRNTAKQREIVKKFKSLPEQEQAELTAQIESTIPKKARAKVLKDSSSPLKKSKIRPINILPVADPTDDGEYEDVIKPLSKTAQAAKERAARVQKRKDEAWEKSDKKIQDAALKSTGIQKAKGKGSAKSKVAAPPAAATAAPASRAASPVASLSGKGFKKLSTAKGGDIPELTALIGKKDQYNMGKASLKSNEILNDIDDARVKSKKIIIPTEDLMNVQRYENAKRIYKNV